MSSSERALALARRHAQRGVRSAGEVRAYLKRLGVANGIVEQAVRACQVHGLLDDRVGARLWADHLARRGYAWALIRSRLLAKRFSSQAIQDAAGTYGTAEQEEQRARQVVRRLLVRAARDPQEARRVARRLVARGFELETIERMLADVFSAMPNTPSASS